MKINKLLSTVAATAIFMSVFSQGANAATVKSLQEKEGTIANAYAGPDGTGIFYGEPQDKDQGFYFITDKSVKRIDSDNSDYGSVKSYVDFTNVITDGDYSIAVKTGKVTEDYSLDLEGNFYKKAKKSEVYNLDSAKDVTFTSSERIGNTSNWLCKLGDRFVIVNESGTYLDISRYINLTVMYSGMTSPVKVKEFNKDYTGVKAILKDAKVIATDKSYFYIEATVDITYPTSKTATEKILMKTDKVGAIDSDTNYVKAITSYYTDSDVFASTDFAAVDGNLYSIDVDTAKDEATVGILKSYKEKVDSQTRNSIKIDDTKNQSDIKTYSTDKYGNIWLLGDGKIYGFDGKEIKQFYKTDSGADKFSVYDSNNVIAWEDSGNNYYYYLSKSKTDTTTTTTGDTTTTTDANGNVTTTSEEGVVTITDATGKVVSVTNKDANGNSITKDATGAIVKVSSTDAFGVTTVKDAKGVIISTSTKDANGNTSTTDAKGIVTVTDSTGKVISTTQSDNIQPPVKGWYKNKDKVWFYYEDSKQATNKWIQDNSKWYFLNTDGTMRTGWFKSPSSGKYYYLNADGSMATGWTKSTDDNEWYYFGTDGTKKSGWIQDSGNWYYLDQTGVMMQGWLNSKGQYYYLGENGSMRHDEWIGNYYVGSNGAWSK